MRVRRNYLYAVLAVAAAVAYGVGEGAYWVTDAAVLAAVAVAVGILCLADRPVDHLLEILTFGLGARYRARGAKTAAAEPTQTERMPRSRIVHYVTVSRLKSTAAIAKQADTPFERALLSQPEWWTLSGRGLEEITRKATDASAKSIQ